MVLGMKRLLLDRVRLISMLPRMAPTAFRHRHNSCICSSSSTITNNSNNCTTARCIINHTAFMDKVDRAPCRRNRSMDRAHRHAPSHDLHSLLRRHLRMAVVVARPQHRMQIRQHVVAVCRRVGMHCHRHLQFRMWCRHYQASMELLAVTSQQSCLDVPTAHHERALRSWRPATVHRMRTIWSWHNWTPPSTTWPWQTIINWIRSATCRHRRQCPIR